MAASDIDARLHSEWRKWWETEKDPASTNKARMEEHQMEQVRKSFGFFSERPLSSKEPEGWTNDMSRFAERSTPDSETLLSFVVRFEKRFPEMINRVGQDWFETVRGDIQVVPSNNDKKLFQ